MGRKASTLKGHGLTLNGQRLGARPLVKNVNPARELRQRGLAVHPLRRSLTVSENSTTPPLTGQPAPEHAADVPAAKPGPTPTQRIARLAGSKGGRNARAVALLGLGLPADQMPALDLRTSDARLRVLEAVAQAVALGKTSGLVATTLVSIVREARADANDELSRLVQAQAARLAELESGAVVTTVWPRVAG
jgi:hypothetical protein